MPNNRYLNSNEHLKRAETTIPLGSQTFSKSKSVYPIGISPLFVQKAKGSYVWDIDGNRYLDLVNSLAAVTLGYRNKRVDNAVKKQMKKGTIFSLPGLLESEVAELVVQTVPSAEMVRFAKNGTDATSAAIRIARAYTSRDHIAFCGYHGWQDWYIGATNRNKGVPQQVSELTHKFIYNDLKSLENIFELYPDKVACVIMEPMNSQYPSNNFLVEVRLLCRKYGAVLVFDETITGYRFNLGGAQKEFNVIPDLTTLGKGIANGYPLSVIAGKKELMMEMENIFFSGTFGGELLSLAAAREVITIHFEQNVSHELTEIGEKVSFGVEKIISDHNLDSVLNLSGHPTWKFLNWSPFNDTDMASIKTFFLQQMFSLGILASSTHNLGLTISDRQIDFLLSSYDTVLGDIRSVLENGTLKHYLNADPIKPIFNLR